MWRFKIGDRCRVVKTKQFICDDIVLEMYSECINDIIEISDTLGEEEFGWYKCLNKEKKYYMYIQDEYLEKINGE